MDLDAKVTAIKGIGSKTEKLLNRIGVYTVKDILLYFPKDYIRYQQPAAPYEITSEGIYETDGPYGTRTDENWRREWIARIGLVSYAVYQKPVKARTALHILW